MNEICQNPHCGKPITVSVFKGTDHCSENCRKALEEIRETSNDSQCKWAPWCKDPADPCGYCPPHCDWVSKREEEMANS